MKVVLNSYYGGFSISKKAIDYMVELGDPELLKALEYGHDLTQFQFYQNRTSPALIKAVEDLGHEANGRVADLVVVEVEDCYSFDIGEYDGREYLTLYVRITEDELIQGISQEKLDLIKENQLIKLV